MATPLPANKIASELATLPGWKFKRQALEKTFTFGTFREAFSFMQRIAFEAEAMNHHPSWTNTYNTVAVRLNSHDAGDRVTAKDVSLAVKIQKISWVG